MKLRRQSARQETSPWFSWVKSQIQRKTITQFQCLSFRIHLLNETVSLFERGRKLFKVRSVFWANEELFERISGFWKRDPFVWGDDELFEPKNGPAKQPCTHIPIDKKRIDRSRDCESLESEGWWSVRWSQSHRNLYLAGQTGAHMAESIKWRDYRVGLWRTVLRLVGPWKNGNFTLANLWRQK